MARLLLTMAWATLLPDDESSPSGPQHQTLPDALASSLWEQPLVEHTTVVDVEIAFDHEGRIVRYVEGPPHRGRLKFQADWACLETFGFARALKDGDVVTDLGEVYPTERSPMGLQLARHVRLRSGEDAWVQDTRSYAVDNPAGGTSAGASQCLVPE